MQGYKLIPLNGKRGQDKFAIVDTEDLINELGSMVGEWIDGQSED